MRIRITRTPPPSYGVDGADLRVGRIYNLEWSLASALMCDGCAEYFDAATGTLPKEDGIETPDAWQAGSPRRALEWPFRFPDEAAET
jgi:hypothetical protein